MNPTQHTLLNHVRQVATAYGRASFGVEDLAAAFFALKDHPEVRGALQTGFGRPAPAIAWPRAITARWERGRATRADQVPAGMPYEPSAKALLSEAYLGSDTFDLGRLAKALLGSATATGAELRSLNPGGGLAPALGRELSHRAEAAHRREGMRAHLASAVFGQTEAVETLADAYHQSLLAPGTQGCRALVTLLGPPGTGKTSLCKTFAEAMNRLGTPHPFKAFDIATYRTEHAPEQLFGFARTYTSAQPGFLTDFVLQNPVSVILLDEMEKAGPATLNGFLRILDEGKAFDNFHAMDVDFSQCWVLMTTNLGQEHFQEGAPGSWSRGQLLELLHQATEPDPNEEGAGRRILPAAMVSRMAQGHLLAMNRLGGRQLVQVFRAAAAHKAASLGLPPLEIGDGEAMLSLLGDSTELDARRAASLGDTFVQQLLPAILEATAGGGLQRLRVRMDAPAASLVRRKLDALPLKVAVGGQARRFKAALAPRAILSLPFTGNLQERVDAVLLDVPDLDSAALDDPRLADLPVLGSADARLRARLATTHPGSAAWAWTQPRHRHAAGEFLDQVRLDQVFREQARSGATVTARPAVTGTEGDALIITLGQAREAKASDRPRPGARAHPMAHPEGGFDQLIGLREAKARLQAVGRLLEAPHAHAAPARGYLLCGPPGTGKTSLARAMAATFRVPFFAITPMDLASRYRGAGSVRLREVFAEARKYAPAIVFVDELDGIAQRRGGGGLDPEALQVLGTLLTCMDGIRGSERPVFVLGATNCPESLDEALLRPGRFDGRIPLDLPAPADREAILQHYLADQPGQVPLALTAFAERCFRFSPAALEGLVRSARQQADQEGRMGLALADLEHALEMAQLGPRTEGLPAGAEVQAICAAHEAGHAIVHHHLRPDVPVVRVDIVTRASGAGGVHQSTPREAISFSSARSLRQELAILMAGRAGEAKLLGAEDAVTGGCANDLQRATDLARQAVLHLGFDPELSRVALSEQDLANNQALAHQVHQRISAWIAEGEQLAAGILETHGEVWNRVREALLREEVLTGEALRGLLDPVPEHPGPGSAKTVKDGRRRV